MVLFPRTPTVPFRNCKERGHDRTLGRDVHTAQITQRITAIETTNIIREFYEQELLIIYFIKCGILRSANIQINVVNHSSLFSECPNSIQLCQVSSNYFLEVPLQIIICPQTISWSAQQPQKSQCNTLDLNRNIYPTARGTKIENIC